MKEACTWLSYTYLFVRMLKNPLAYGIAWEEIAGDPRLEGHRKTLITTAARQLEKWEPLHLTQPSATPRIVISAAEGPSTAVIGPQRLESRSERRCKMARFDERSGQLYVTELGRVASHFYIRHASIVAFNDMLKPHMSEAEVTHVPQRMHGLFQGSPWLDVCAVMRPLVLAPLSQADPLRASGIIFSLGKLTVTSLVASSQQIDNSLWYACSSWPCWRTAVSLRMWR